MRDTYTHTHTHQSGAASLPDRAAFCMFLCRLQTNGQRHHTTFRVFLDPWIYIADHFPVWSVNRNHVRFVPKCEAECGRASSAATRTGEVPLAIAVHFARAIPAPMAKIGIASGFAQEEG